MFGLLTGWKAKLNKEEQIEYLTDLKNYLRTQLDGLLVLESYCHSKADKKRHAKKVAVAQHQYDKAVRKLSELGVTS